MSRVYNVLFLCTGNSARSILAESILNRLGLGRFRAFSAGSQPRGEVHPLAIELLDGLGFPVDGLHSKSWDVFAAAGAPAMDFVVTVCDNAAGEACPVWPGHPMTVHWGLPDPAAVDGGDDDRRAAFRTAFDALASRLRQFIDVPLATLDRPVLRQRLDAIGRPPPGVAAE